MKVATATALLLTLLSPPALAADCPAEAPGSAVRIDWEGPCYVNSCGIDEPVTFSLIPQESGGFPPALFDPGYSLQPCDTVTWNFDDGTPEVTTHGSQSVQHTFSSAASRRVTAVISNALGSVTITGLIDIDDEIRIFLGHVEVSEAAAVANLPLRRMGGLARTASLQLMAGNDSELTHVRSFSGIVTFGPGEREKSVAIPIINDSWYRGDHFEFVFPRNAAGGTAVTNGGIMIRDDEPVPLLQVDDVEVIEGNAGLTEVQLTARLSAPMGDRYCISVDVGRHQLHPDPSWPSTTATRDVDFEPKNDLACIERGALSAAMTFVVKGDTAPEPDEVILLLLSPLSIPYHQQPFAICTILDDDTASLQADPPSVSMHVGERRSVRLSLSLPVETEQLVLLWWTGSAAVDVPSMVLIPPGGNAEAMLEAKTRGTGTVSATIPALGITTSIAVDVAGPSRRRAVR